MKKEDIMRRAIGEIDDDLIEDANIDEDSPIPLRKRKPVILKRVVIAVLAAAVSALLIIGGLSIGRPGTPVIHPEATSQTDPPDTGTEPEHSFEPKSTKEDTGKATDTTGIDDKKQTETDGEPSTEPAATDSIPDPVDPTVDPATEPVTEPELTGPARTEPKPKDTSGGKDTQKPPVTPESSQKTDPPPATESSSDPDKEDIIVPIEGSQITPDFDLAVSISDAIVKGEVIEEYESGHSNPTGKALNAIGETIPYGIVTKYSFRVDEVYKGDLKPGDVISLETVLDTGIPASVYEKYNVILDGTPFELTAGQSGIFLIAKDEVWTEPTSGDFYVVVHGEWGFLKGPDGDGFYSSRVYKATPASLVSLIDELK